MANTRFFNLVLTYLTLANFVTNGIPNIDDYKWVTVLRTSVSGNAVFQNKPWKKDYLHR